MSGERAYVTAWHGRDQAHVRLLPPPSSTRPSHPSPIWVRVSGHGASLPQPHSPNKEVNSSFQDVGTHPPFLKPFITPSATCPSLSLEVARSLIPTKHMHTSKHVCTHTHIHTDTCLGSHRHTHLHTAEELCPEGHGCGGLIHTQQEHQCTHTHMLYLSRVHTPGPQTQVFVHHAYPQEPTQTSPPHMPPAWQTLCHMVTWKCTCGR